jgi:hypothetical protein
LAALLLVAARSAHAGPIATQADLATLLGSGLVVEDFETLSVRFGGQRYDTGPLSSATLFDGDGPGLVQPGAIYSGNEYLFWNGDAYFGLDTQTLGDSSDWRGWPMTITYTTPVTAMGFDMQAYRGLAMTGVVSVYDLSDVLLSATAVNGGFFGWENAAGIGRVVIAAQPRDTYIMIDNHGYGSAIPEPATLLLIAAGLGAIAVRRPLKKRA